MTTPGVNKSPGFLMTQVEQLHYYHAGSFTKYPRQTSQVALLASGLSTHGSFSGRIPLCLLA